MTLYLKLCGIIATLDRLITELTLRNVFLANPFSALNWSTEPMCKLTERYTHEQIKQFFSYDPLTGAITRLTDNRQPSRTPDNKGYLTTRITAIGKVKQLRLAFFIHNGYIPVQIDHINGVKNDNRIANLRPADNRSNQMNSGVCKSNTTGFKGVKQLSIKTPKTSRVTRTKNKAFSASIGGSDNRIYLGAFDTAIEAAKAYDIKALELYGEFARTNKSMGLYQ